MLYLQDPENPDDARNGPYEPDDFFTLEPANRRKKRLEPKDIVGSFKTGVLTGEILELRKTKGVMYGSCCADSSPGAILDADGYLTSAWEMQFDWDGGPEEGQLLVVSTVRDDNGNPFIEVKFFHGYSGCAPHSVSIIGKKRVPGEEIKEREELDEDNEEVYYHGAKLSKAEMWRLGCGVDFKELKLRLEKRKARREKEKVAAEKANKGKGKKGKPSKVVDDEEEYGEVPDFSDEEDSESDEEDGESDEESDEEDTVASRKRRADGSSSSAPSKRRKTESKVSPYADVFISQVLTRASASMATEMIIMFIAKRSYDG